MYFSTADRYGNTAPAWLSRGLLLLCLIFISPASAFVDVPKLESPVTDQTGTLTTEEVRALESKLLAFESKKGSQIVVLIVPTTQPEDIAEFGIKVMDLNRIGRKKIDDGVLLIIAKDDKKFRIEVGYGLEGVIPDAVAKRITSEIIKPYFKNNDFAGGINAGVDQLMKLIEGEALPEPARQGSYQGGDGSFLYVLFGGLFAGSMLSTLFGRVTGALMAGVGTALVASGLMGFGIGAVLAGLIVFFLLSARFGGGGGWSNGGGYSGGYGGSYGGGSWGGSDSSWSGGGGSSGGGGASDSW